MKLYRQGDVLIVAIDLDQVPANAVPVKRENGRAILAHGEVTGHSHAILDKHAELVTTDDDLISVDEANELYLLVYGTDPVELVHDEHTTIPLPGGTTDQPAAYKIVRQREYTPEAPRQVAD
jgi:hypothetical protein